MDLREAKNIHFIGIGGIGISAIARMMLLEGRAVTGSDRSASKVTEELEKAGARVTIGQKAENIPSECDLVVYTVAIPADSPEFVEAKRRSLPVMTYPQTLEAISKEKFTVAVSGTHGKTTTTAMIAKVLMDAGLDPMVIVGSLMKLPDGRESNYIPGKGKFLVVEADEYKKSFHNIHPSALVINNLDLDHLDFYKDLADIQGSFKEVAMKVSTEGFIVTNLANENVGPVIEEVRGRIIDYGPYVKEVPKLLVPGAHNRSNAGAALALAEALGVDAEAAKTSLASYEGTWRRFEFKGKMSGGALVYDDYAHNPQKVRAAIQGAKEAFPDKKIVAVFQPHLYSRTKTLFNDFSVSFVDADEVLFLPIYPAREVFDASISSEMLAEAIGGKTYKNFGDIEKVIREQYDSPNNIILIMGAGDINEVGEALVRAQE